MRKREKIQMISQILDELYPEPPIPLDHSSHYTLLIAVLLSAQCTDKRVNAITPALFAKASTAEEMIQLTVDEIKEIIKPCGLSPTKSKAIWNLSQLLIDNWNAQVPETFEELESLPGVGHKTASVIMSQAFQKPAFPVDTHIHRCAKRWGLSSGKSIMQTEKDLKAVFSKRTWSKRHLQIIFFARQYCPALRHNIENCPICSRLD
jgi:endonuclease-3